MVLTIAAKMRKKAGAIGFLRKSISPWAMKGEKPPNSVTDMP